MRKEWLIAALVLVAFGCSGMTNSVAAKEGEKEADEVKIRFSEAPAAVQATLSKESGGAKIDTVDKESEDGKTTYEADVTVDGKNWELKVAEDGTLISKKLDQEEEKNGKDEKDEKDEKHEKHD